jgi:hypothetical protein
MERMPVDSEALRSVGYEGGTLEIEFSSGSVYQYFDVQRPNPRSLPMRARDQAGSHPQHIHEELMRADSHGEFFRILPAAERSQRADEPRVR